MADSGRTLTYAQYEGASNQFAHYLRTVGLQPGDHVAILMENHETMLVAEGGAERVGLHYTCVNSYLAAVEAAYIVDNCRAEVVVTSAAKLPLVRDLVPLCPGVRHWVVVGDPAPPAPFESWERVVETQPTGYVEDEQLGAAMLYSSGTTGQPKGILRDLPGTHPSVEPEGSSTQRRRWGLDEGCVYLSPAPLYHAAPQGSVSLALRAGALAVIMESFGPERFLDLVAEHRVTHSQVVPTMLSRILKLPAEVRAAADVSSLRTIVLSSAPCPPAVKAAIIEWWGPVVMEFYAASEGIGFTVCTSEEWLAHPGTVGKAAVGEILILDDAKQPVPTGTPGTIWFKNDVAFNYFGDAGKTAGSRDERLGASTVGDVGYLDDEGYLYLTDRKSFMIISGGVNIYPQETENLLITHPKVLDAAVLGVPDDDLGEVVKAVVQPMDGIEPTSELERELIDFCRDSIAHFKCPRSVDFVDELPRLPTGKLYKRVLRERYWGDRETRI